MRTDFWHRNRFGEISAPTRSCPSSFLNQSLKAQMINLMHTTGVKVVGFGCSTAVARTPCHRDCGFNSSWVLGFFLSLSLCSVSLIRSLKAVQHYRFSNGKICLAVQLEAPIIKSDRAKKLSLFALIKPFYFSTVKTAKLLFLLQFFLDT